jgi:Endosomal/lysosomal potassium channel TMEM175
LFDRCHLDKLTGVTQNEEEISSSLPADLDSLPRLKGFRLRGLEMTRLETFIDAAFAFAVTMLVISTGQVPDDIQALLVAFKNVPAFVASIAVLSIFWRGHWLWSRRFGLEDGVSILISWMMLVTILLYVYPLKLLFGGMFYYLTAHAVGQSVIAHTEGQVRALFAIYGLGFSAIAVEILLLNLRAWRLRGALRLNDHEKSLTRRELFGWSTPAAVGLTSLLLALTLPGEYIQWSGWVYMSMAFLVPLQRRWHARSRARRSKAAASGASMT